MSGKPIRRVEGPPKVKGAPAPEDYTPVKSEDRGRQYRLPRVYDPSHPEADKDGRRPAHPHEHKMARQQESGQPLEPDTDHSIFDW
jgi:hypothetical protein